VQRRSMLGIMSDFDLILAASTPRLDDEAQNNIAALVKAVSDWDNVLKLARTVRAMPILHQRLATCAADNVPPAILAHLEQAHLANTARTATMTRCLAIAMQALNKAGIPSLAYKGPTLAQLAYDEPGLRQFDDLDILVPGAHLREAKSILEAQGYAEILGLPPHVEPLSFRLTKPYILRHGDGSHDIDVSQALLHDYFSFPVPASYVWGSTHRVEVDGCSLPTVSIGVLILFLCVHGSKHLWARPAWIADVAGVLLRQHAAVDWPSVRKLAVKADGVRMLQLGIDLAARLYRAPVPREEESWLTPSTTVNELSDRIMARQRACAGAPEKDDWERVRLHLALRERTRSRLRYLFVRGLTPSYNDWRSFRLPGALFPLYIPYRLGRLTIRALQHPFRQSQA
jgi:hypothetical protein